MQRADEHVEGQPNDQQPTGPIMAVKHKHAGDNLGTPGKMDHPMFLEVGKPLNAIHVYQRPQSGNERNGAEHQKQPADNSD